MIFQNWAIYYCRQILSSGSQSVKKDESCVCWVCWVHEFVEGLISLHWDFIQDIQESLWRKNMFECSAKLGKNTLVWEWKAAEMVWSAWCMCIQYMCEVVFSEFCGLTDEIQISVVSKIWWFPMIVLSPLSLSLGSFSGKSKNTTWLS